MTRRTLLKASSTAAFSTLVQSASPQSASSFPAHFLWGAATAAHQVEGNNINSDLWVLEHCNPTLFEEPSLDACDHYHRFRDDIRLLASLGLNSHRASSRARN